MKKSLHSFFKFSLISSLLIASLSSNLAYAQNSEFDEDQKQTSKVFSGKIDLKYIFDHLLNNKKNIPNNEGYLSAGADLQLKLDDKWAIKSTLTAYNFTHKDANTFQPFTRISSDRSFKSNTALIIEELKLYFENKDIKLWGGKFNPQFAILPDSKKVSGIFSADFTSDYQLVEAIGAGGELPIGEHKLVLNSFFSDATFLNRSALHHRNSIKSHDGSVGNTSSLSSYIIVVNGNNFLLENLSYNLGYRSLGVEKMPQASREIGYTGGLSYLFELENGISLSPLVELVKINNFAGVLGNNNSYASFALMTNYNKISAGILNVYRNIKQKNSNLNLDDSQLQFSLGYKFTENLSTDFTMLKLNENNDNNLLLGAMIKYSYKF
jgi:hypothetical protein